MPFAIKRDNQQIIKVDKKTFDTPTEVPQKLSIVYDTEFTFTNKLKLDARDRYPRNSLIVDSVQIYSKELNYDVALVFTRDELTNDFNPFINIWKSFNYDVRILDDDSLQDLTARVYELFEELTEHNSNQKQLKRVLDKSINEGYFDEILNEYNIPRDYLKYTRKHKHSELLIQPTIIEIEYTAFFADVDLFKSIGQNYQQYLLDANLESRRVITFSSHRDYLSMPYIYINGNLYEIRVRFRDLINRFPVLSGRGLDNQCKVYKATTKKIDIETESIACKLGLGVKEIKQNMSLVKELEPILFIQYGAVDVFATSALGDKQQELLDGIRKDFNLEVIDIKDTTGSNVSRFIHDLMIKHFGAIEKEDIAFVKSRNRLNSADNIQNLELNDFGIQTLRTVGGLLYSRTARNPYLKGKFGDLDESSCYATKLSNMDIYLGTPIISTFKGKKYKQDLRDVLEFVSHNCPRDAWLIRVSGKLKDALNTIVLSDLSFKSKREKFKTIFDIEPSRRSISSFNAFKKSNKEAQSTMLLKEVKFGLINADIWDVIKLLPEDWINEYLELKVDAVVFIPNELICDTTEELKDKMQYYPEDSTVESFDKATGLKGIKAQYSQKNLCLRFPIGDYYKELKAKRAKYKKEKNPIQEVYKLFLNSGYGALACEHLAVNNLLAANQITASARATSWMMVNALNGFQVITDGSTFSWEHIPIGKTFRELIKENSYYLVDFDSSIESKLRDEDFNQSWIDKEFRNHLYKFFGTDKNHAPSNLYGFELKTENFDTEQGLIKDTVLFTEFVNHGSGSYSKGLADCRILIEGHEYNIAEPSYSKVKARSFKGSDANLLNWYIDVLKNGYKEPYIYQENQIIKFADGNQLAIRILKDSDVHQIAHPMGFSKSNYKLMKIITRSQFLFNNEKQLRNFETTNQLNKLDNLTKFVLTAKFWRTLDFEKLGVEKNPNIDYHAYAKDRPIGLGFELLCLTRTHKGSVESVRNLIADKIREGKTEFNSALNLDRNLDLAKEYANTFAKLTVLRANSDYELKEMLKNSVNEPTVMVVTEENIYSLQELMSYQES